MFYVIIVQHATDELTANNGNKNVSDEEEDYRSFFIHEKSITGPVYQDMLKQFLYPQVADLQPQVIFQQNGAPPQCSLDV